MSKINREIAILNALTMPTYSPYVAPPEEVKITRKGNIKIEDTWTGQSETIHTHGRKAGEITGHDRGWPY